MGHLSLAGTYADGGWTQGATTLPIEVINPTDASMIAIVQGGGRAEMDKAIAAARRAQPKWAALHPDERAAYLVRIADALERRADHIAQSIALNIGMPLKLSRMIQVGLPIETLRNVAQITLKYAFDRQTANSIVVMQPVGVVGAITPWNYPLHQIVAKVAPALAAGNTVVVKPSEVAPLAARALAEAVDEVGLPPGVFNLVIGFGPDAGQALVESRDVNMISFTGSTQTGKAIARLAADHVKRLALELGGKSASVVLEDGNIEQAVKSTVASCFLNSGQTCSALTRLVVPKSQHARVAELAAAAAAKFTIGDPMDPAVRLGPLVSAVQRDRARGFVARAINEGTSLVCGGVDSPSGFPHGFFFKPTIFSNVSPDSEIAQEEVFGPVLAIISYEGEEEAIRIANGTRYGLAGAVWSEDPIRAEAVARRMRTGQVDINGGRYNPLAPFGGFGESGFGREMGEFGFEEFVEPTAIQK